MSDNKKVSCSSTSTPASYVQKYPLPRIVNVKPQRDKARGDIIFSDHPEFLPNLDPKEIFQTGSFGGTYFRPIFSCVTGELYGDEVWQEFPRDWFPKDIDTYVRSPVCRKDINRYKTTSGQSLRIWEEKGWITPIDPYGWMQWYLRFYNGRRCYDDERQIDRWNRVAGSKSGRWRKNLQNRIKDAAKIAKVSPKTLADDTTIRPVLRQLLQQWAFRVRDHHL